MSEIKQGYKQTKVGIIPEDWEVVKLESISDFITKGATPTTYGFNWQEDGIPFLRSECVSDNGLNLKAAMYICQDAHNVMKRSAITSGDILMTITGNVGRVILLENFQEGNINQHIARIRIIKEIANRNFIFSFLSQSTYQINYSKITTGQAYPQLSLVQVRDSFVAFPPIKEQEKIAEILTTWDEAITKQEELIKAKELQKKALMQKLLSGEVRFCGFNDEWHFYKLGDLLDYEQPTNYLVNDTNYDDSFNTPVLTAGKTFILGYTNETDGIYKEQLPVIIFDDFTTATQFVNFPFKAKSSAMKILKSKGNLGNIKVIFELMQIIKYQADDHKRYWISEYQDLEIKLPSLHEQQKIAEVLSLADDEINLLKNELEELKQQKKALMQKLLTGQVRVKV